MRSEPLIAGTLPTFAKLSSPIRAVAYYTGEATRLEIEAALRQRREAFRRPHFEIVAWIRETATIEANPVPDRPPYRLSLEQRPGFKAATAKLRSGEATTLLCASLFELAAKQDLASALVAVASAFKLGSPVELRTVETIFSSTKDPFARGQWGCLGFPVE